MSPLEAETVAFLEGGCALIVGSVAPDGEPHASRGWGLDVLCADPITVRVLLDADDSCALANLDAGAAIAITAADVPTLRSLQLKGRVTAVDPCDDADRQRAERFRDSFFRDITAQDGTARPVLDRLVPRHYTACTVAVDEVFDQTPGPQAGQRVAG